MARQRRVVPGWRSAPPVGLGVAGLGHAVSSVVVRQQHPGLVVVVVLALASVLVAFLAARALAEAPDDLGLARR